MGYLRCESQIKMRNKIKKPNWVFDPHQPGGVGQSNSTSHPFVRRMCARSKWTEGKEGRCIWALFGVVQVVAIGCLCVPMCCPLSTLSPSLSLSLILISHSIVPFGKTKNNIHPHVVVVQCWLNGGGLPFYLGRTCLV